MSQIDASIFFDPQSNQKEILLADLQTAKWIERINLYTDLEQLAEHFIYYHHHLTQTIIGTTVKRLEQIDKLFLGTVIQKWSTLYSTALSQLRKHFPLNSAPSLTVNSKDWSEILLINSVGLARLANESRYAEYWAEKSLCNSTVYDSYADRLEFLTTDLHLQLSHFKLTGSLTIYDTANLGVTTYDIAKAVYESPDLNFIKHFRSLGWQVVSFNEDASQLCLLLYEFFR
ncbi:hypothetical protein [Trichocoleus sp. FACHB-262]|uniref:hypothetical protein n=1 Tax=Trichocoleus sp. FACHB-262 TaxID=2692869 RepID=UPI001682C4EE|nr:hypothetical protein [Trichocoleus sp. FACHB-262]MBD2120280.1 hypothetical protein [Trichocoleus sp. FACHB-262]